MPYFIALFAAALALGLARAGEAPPEPNSGHEPPRFSDPARADRVRALEPEIARVYREFAASNHIPGLAYGVVLDGEVLFTGSLGVARVSGEVPASPRTLFRIASMTKSFTAMAILRLRDQGRLELDAPAARYLPELKRLRPLTQDSPPITVRHLLTHSAGFPEDNPWGDWQLADSPDDLARLAREGISLSNPPGIAYEYSNLGFALLGRIVTKVSRSSCQEYIGRTILAPLGMTHAQWDFHRVPDDQRARGYRWEEDRWLEEPMIEDGVFGPMGGLICSVDEFAKYIALHLAAWPPRDGAERGPLKRSSIREMHQPGRFVSLWPDSEGPDGQPCPAVSTYGFGLVWTRDCAGRIAVGHSGGLPGFGSNWRILPGHGLGIVLLANRTYAPATAVNNQVASLILAKARLEPREIAISRILQLRKDQLVRLLPDWDGAEQSGLFAENFFRDQKLALRRKAARELFQKAGSIERIGELKPENDLRGGFEIAGSGGAIEVSFTLTPENPPLIQHLKLSFISR